MPGLETTLAFLAVSLLLGFSPGPDNLFVLMQTMSQGRRAGVLVVLGLCTGLVVHTVAVALGVAAVFAASPTAFVIVKFVGAAYLAWLAWQAWRAPVSAGLPGRGADLPAMRLYGRGVIMNLTNPKVVLFFLAFLPQFVAPNSGPIALQLCWFGLIFIVATLISFGVVILLADFIGHRLRRSAGAQRFLNRASALVFVGLALRLAISER